MNFIFLLMVVLGASNIIVDLNIFSFKPFTCKACLGFHIGVILSINMFMLKAYLNPLELITLPFAAYFINKLNQEKLL